MIHPANQGNRQSTGAASLSAARHADCLLAFRAWLTGSLDDQPRDVRKRLLASVIETPATLLISIISICAVAVLAWWATGEAWPLYWLVAEIVLSTGRSALILRLRSASYRPARYYEALVVATALVWCGVLAFGIYMCAASGHPALVVAAAVTAVGVGGAASSRVAALPRYGAILIVACYAPLSLGLLAWPVPEMKVLAAVVPLLGAALFALMLQNFHMKLRMVRAEMQTQRAALTDRLTELPNRAFLEEQLDSLCERLEPGDRFAVLSLDLDGFKQVNDLNGHGAGDLLLKAVAERLTAAVRTQDHVCRLGGDEFVVLLPGAGDHEAAFVAKRILAAIGRPFDIGLTGLVRVGVSIGGAMAPCDGTARAPLLAAADSALYAAKRDGKARYALYGGGAGRAVPELAISA